MASVTITVLGLELLSITVEQSEPGEPYDSGVTGSMPIGFTPSAGDQRWESGVEA